MQMFDRHAAGEVRDALAASRAVAIVGPRQSGKTTLAMQLVDEGTLARYVTLDDERSRSFAREDGVGFVESLPHGTVIDEIQRVPELLLEIKRVLDLGDQRAGQFLLTGSADLRRMRSTPDALPGRVEYVEILPLTQGEILGVADHFVDRVFDGTLGTSDGASVDRGSVAGMLVSGGFPGVLGRSERRRTSFLASYLDGLVVDASLPDVDVLRQPARVLDLLRVLAPRSAQILNVADAASVMAASERSVRGWLNLLTIMYLAHLLPSWHTNLDKRRVKRPKFVVADSGLHCHLLGVDADRLVADRTLLGAVLETFVFCELQRQSVWSRLPYRLHHYRDRDGREVDLVAERADGSVVGIEVKATATPTSGDLVGLRHLRATAGDRWRGGVVVTLAGESHDWGGALRSVPLDALWGG